jgi:hypothetical protein
MSKAGETPALRFKAGFLRMAFHHVSKNIGLQILITGLTLVRRES